MQNIKNTLMVMRGLPSSGKSTLANILQKQLEQATQTLVYIFSTDNYWMRPDGYYDWNFRRLKEAHEWNLSKFVKSFHCGFYQCCTKIVRIIDNTNTTFKEFEKYITAAIEHDLAELFIVEPNTEWKFDVDELVKRNTHGVPRESIERMLARWESSEKVCEQIKSQFNIEPKII